MFVVNTMPEKTLTLSPIHGNGAPSIKGTYEKSHAIMNKLADLGINIKDVTDKLEADSRSSLHQVLGHRPRRRPGWHFDRVNG